MSSTARRLLLCALAAFALVSVAAASRTASAATPSPAALLARHVPILVLHPQERFRPVPVDGFLEDSDLQERSAAGWQTIPGPLPAGRPDLRLNQRSCSAIEGLAASPCYVAAQAAHPSPPVVYGAVRRSATRIDLQYWVFYPYNDYSPQYLAGQVWQVHEADWESVSVILDLQGRPLQVGLSRHCSGTRRAWSRVEKRGERPVVYAALGSHANYFGVGRFRHSPECWPPELRDVVRALRLYDRTAVGTTIRPALVPISATSPSWNRFAGRWGEDGYVHFPNNNPIAYQGSPRSPAFQSIWRAPVLTELSWPLG